MVVLPRCVRKLTTDVLKGNNVPKAKLIESPKLAGQIENESRRASVTLNVLIYCETKSKMLC